MILIGEKLNSSIPKTLEAFQQRDQAAVCALIERQQEAGAEYLDINAAICGEDELEVLTWVIGLVKAYSDCKIMIDTSDPEVMAKAAEAAKDRELIFNSTTLDERFTEVTALAKQYHAGVVALPISQEGMPHTLEEKCSNIDRLVEKLRSAGIPDEKMYVDVLIETLATNSESAKIAIGAIRHVAEKYPQVHTTCGLSNISFGLPKRGMINSAFLSAARMAGLSSAILDPSNPQMRDTLAASAVVAGEDDYCMEYITYIRSQEGME